MLQSAKGFNGMAVLGKGRSGSTEELGRVSEFFFDDQSWGVRYWVVRLGPWPVMRKILLPPHAIQRLDWVAREVHTPLSRDQIETSPEIDTESEISRGMEAEYLAHFRWPHLFTGAGVFGIPSTQGFPDSAGWYTGPKKQEVHLKSSRKFLGYPLHSSDNHLFGHVDDCLFEDESWVLRYFVVDTKNWWPNRDVLISTGWVRQISWVDRHVNVALTEEAIKSSPRYVSETRIDRDYEEQLFSHYGRRRYWESDKIA